MPMPTNASASSARTFATVSSSHKRDEAKYADLVVVNHALFFLDLAMGGGLLAALRRRRARRGASMRALGNRCADGGALTSDDRPHDAQAATHVRSAEPTSSTSSRADSRGWSRALRGVSAKIAIRSQPTKTRGRRWQSLPRNALRSGELALCQSRNGAQEKQVENEAEAERRRDLALRRWFLRTKR